MFVGGGGGDVDDLNVAEAAARDPLDEGVDGGNEPDVFHFGVVLVWHERVSERPIDDDGFQNKFAARAEEVSKFVEMIERGAAVVEYPHAEYGVEGRDGRREAFDAERENPNGRGGEVFANREVLHDVEEEGVGAEGESSAFARHAPAVVARAAADIDNEAIL